MSKETQKTYFSIALQNKLKENKMSKAELARLMDVTDTTINRYIKGDAIPRPMLMNRLIKIFKCSKKDFIQKYSSRKKHVL